VYFNCIDVITTQETGDSFQVPHICSGIFTAFQVEVSSDSLEHKQQLHFGPP
jgi:hypothetical protein